MQIYISVMELIPTALKYDPHNRVTSKSVITGMVVMAASLLMFTI
jgi:zinc transporter, ZIP family